MTQRIQQWLEAQIEEAEQAAYCLAPTSRRERDRLRDACDRGAIIEVHPRLFARQSYWSELSRQQQELHKMRSLQVLHPDWVFAGPSAALIYGLSVSNTLISSIWTACSRSQHKRPAKARRSIVVTGDDPVWHKGLRCTSFLRTVCDCMRLSTFRSRLAVADSALRLSGMTQTELANGITLTCSNTAGLVRSRATIALADPRAESGGESIARATMLELGIALPDLQREFPKPMPSAKPYRVDFAWDTQGGCVLGELDGHEKYTSALMRGSRSFTDVIDEEHLRQTHLESLDGVMRMIRFSYADVMRDLSFLALLMNGGVPRTFAFDERVLAAGGVLRCR